VWVADFRSADELRPDIGEEEYAKLIAIIEAAPTEPASKTEYEHP
jgi:hypothetical protein